MEQSEALDTIRKEFATARKARDNGNEGMVRVCARRAAGTAISFWLLRNLRRDWGPDAISQLRHLALDDSFPLSVREAAQHLTTKVTPQFTSPSTTDPVQESRLIIGHLLGTTDEF